MIRRSYSALVFLLLLLFCATPTLAVAGATDRVPAATLLVPFFETGINAEFTPNDTLLVVTNWLFATETFHYHVWDVDGNATPIQGNITLGSLGTWTAAMRNILNAAPPEQRNLLVNGDFYRGFITIDVVTAATALNPRQSGYPFSQENALEGFIYYTRLSQGSANGLAMVPIEAIPDTANSLLRGFYRPGDLREEIDTNARGCAQALASGTACPGAFPGDDIDRFHLRIFRSTPLNGTSRAVIFTWTLGRPEGPSMICDDPASNCPTSYVFRQYNESGAVVQDTTIRLSNVVNVISDSRLVGNQAGWISVLDVPSAFNDTQVYAFSFNSASPSGDANLTWDAIFEGYIVP